MPGMQNILAGARGYSDSGDRTLGTLLAIGQIFSGLGRATSALSDYLRSEELMKFRRAEEKRAEERFKYWKETRGLAKKQLELHISGLHYLS